jgi:orotidine-5'-phosphate decarboxylase
MSSGQQDASQSVPQATQQPSHPVVIGRLPGNPQQRGPVSALLVPGVGLVAAQQQQQQYYRPRPAAAGRTRASLLMSGMEVSAHMCFLHAANFML